MHVILLILNNTICSLHKFPLVLVGFIIHYVALYHLSGYMQSCFYTPNYPRLS